MHGMLSASPGAAWLVGLCQLVCCVGAVCRQGVAAGQIRAIMHACMLGDMWCSANVNELLQEEYADEAEP